MMNQSCSLLMISQYKYTINITNGISRQFYIFYEVANSYNLTRTQSRSSLYRIRKLRRAPETPGGPFALKDYFIVVSFWNLVSGYETMNDHLL